MDPSFTDLKANNLVLVDDLKQLWNATINIKQLIGKPAIGEDGKKLSVWASMRKLTDNVMSYLQTTLVQQATMDEVMLKVKVIQEDLRKSLLALGEEQELQQETYNEHMQHIEKCLVTFEQPFEKNFPILLSVRAEQSIQKSGKESSALQKQVLDLTNHVESMQGLLWNKSLDPLSTSSPASLDVEETMRGKHVQKKMLPKCLERGCSDRCKDISVFW
jgi:hypothetical protein